MNWDDLKYFLMVSRTGSIRGAAAALGVNHATVSRRINNFEQALGQRLFERSAKGYTCTASGHEIYKEALHLEERLSHMERRIAGQDRSMQGEIRVTLPDLLGQSLLMPDFADFSQLYPEIELEIIDSMQPLNLANREADVAFRLCQQPPDYLVGRKLAQVHRACYIARHLGWQTDDDDATENKGVRAADTHWLGWNDRMRRPGGQIARDYPRLRSQHKILNAMLQIEACKNGMGVAVLPCFSADLQPELMRIPPYRSAPQYDLWILNHPDLRQNSKVQTFVRFMVERIRLKQPLLEGQLYTPT